MSNVSMRIEDFRELLNRYGEILGLIDRGMPVATARDYLDRYAASCQDPFIRQVAFDWATRLPQRAPRPPGTTLLGHALRIEESTVEMLEMIDDPIQRDELEAEACARIDEMMRVGHVHPDYIVMLCASIHESANRSAAEVPTSWF